MKHNPKEFMRGSFSGGAGTNGTVAPDTIATLSYLRVIDLICEGPVFQPLKNNSLQSMYLNGTQIQNPDLTYNQLGITVETRPGNPSQTSLGGFPETEFLTNVGLNVKKDLPIIQTLNDPLATLVRFAIQIPSLSFADGVGNVTGWSLNLSLDVQPIGGVYTLTPITITGKTSSAQVFTYEVALPPSGSGSWNLRVQRFTVNSGQLVGGTYTGDSIWSAFVSVSNHKYMYADRCVIGSQVDSYAVAGSDPQRTFHGLWKIISVPSNYDPITRLYTGIWDGTFLQEWSNNPVWVLYDLLINDRYGLGRYVGAYTPDKWKLYEIAQYCDELVPDGFGGMEPRYTFNGPVTASANTQEDAMKVIQGVAGVFNGNVYWGSNTVLVWADMPGDSVKLVTPTNILGGKFAYSGTSAKADHSVALVSWRDPNQFFSGTLEVVPDNERLFKLGWKPAQLSPPGITSRGQAHRMGAWLLDTEKNATELVTFTASLDHAAVVPGEIIEVADPLKRSFRGEGRLAAAFPSQANIDSPFTFLAGVSYYIVMTQPDGTLFVGTVTNAPGTTTNVMFSEVMNPLPVTGSVWVMRCSNAEPRLFRVLRNAENDQHQFEITGLVYDPTKYDRIELGINLTTPSYTAFPSGPIVAPTSIGFSETLFLAAGVTVRAKATFSWTASLDPRVIQYEFQIGTTATGYSAGDVSSSTSRDVFDLDPGLYNVRVRALSGAGALSQWSTQVLNIVGQFEAPDDVKNFQITISGALSTFTWTADTVLNHEYYQMRYSPQTSGVTWGGAAVILDNIQSTNASLPTAAGTYLIKAFTTHDIASVNPADIISTIDPGVLRNVVLLDTESTTFPGVKTNTVVQSSNLRLAGLAHMHDWSTLHTVTRMSASSAGVANYGQYFFSQWLDCGAIMTSRVSFNMVVKGFISSYVMHSWGTLHSVLGLEGSNLDGWSVALSMRTTNSNPNGLSTLNDIAVGNNFTGAGWNFINATPVANQLLGWDGNQMTGWKITAPASSAPQLNILGPTFTGSAETTSVRCKQGNSAFFRFGAFNNTTSTFVAEAEVDWTLGVPAISILLGTGTCGFVNEGNGWYRYWVTYTGTTGNANLQILQPCQGIAGNFNYFNDFQHEKAAVMTPDLVWSPWVPMTISDVSTRAYEFMLELFSTDGAVTPSVSTLAVTVDVPDRFESATSVASGAGVKVITFTHAFQALGGVAIAGLNMATGDYFTITAKSTTGFSVAFFNSSNAAINRNFDWIARGFGQLS